MAKKINTFIFYFTCDNEDNNKIHRLIINGENEKFVTKRFENKFNTCRVLCITKM